MARAISWANQELWTPDWKLWFLQLHATELQRSSKALRLKMNNSFAPQDNSINDKNTHCCATDLQRGIASPFPWSTVMVTIFVILSHESLLFSTFKGGNSTNTECFVCYCSSMFCISVCHLRYRKVWTHCNPHFVTEREIWVEEGNNVSVCCTIRHNPGK